MVRGAHPTFCPLNFPPRQFYFQCAAHRVGITAERVKGGGWLMLAAGGFQAGDGRGFGSHPLRHLGLGQVSGLARRNERPEYGELFL